MCGFFYAALRDGYRFLKSLSLNTNSKILSYLSPKFTALKKLMALCLISISTQYLHAQNYWQQQVNYYIQVSLNDKDHTLDAFEKIDYTNNSPDTLKFIWFHLWPNAYKNDKTAFSEQLLQNGRTDFYFSKEEDRGYINRLDFKANDITLATEAHPKHIDIIKVVLNKPLAPGQTIQITTPFHVKLPFNFSRGGHIGNAYQATQWYPKPAVYDAKGWHEMPYLDQGEFYSEFGNFNVEVTAPEKYIIAASGKLTNAAQYNEMKALGQSDFLNQQPSLDYKASQQKIKTVKPAATKKSKTKPAPIAKKSTNTKIRNTLKPAAVMPLQNVAAVPVKTKTWFFSINNAHDFAWFAAKDYVVQYNEVETINGKKVDVFTYCTPKQLKGNYKDVDHASEAIKFYSEELGDYGYNTVSIVSSPAVAQFTGGMEYPGITLISLPDNSGGREEVIVHEVGHNWFMGVLASNEREHPWMDEGMNSFYDHKYMSRYKSTATGFVASRAPESEYKMLLETVTGVKKDQPIETRSDSFTYANYGLIAYEKSAEWMKQLQRFENYDAFEEAMKSYYKKWQFKHPYPADFKAIVDETFKRYGNRNTDSVFAKLNTTGSLNAPVKKKTKLAFLFNLKNTDSINYISVAPAFGYNKYDKFMVGGIVHNYQLPFNRVDFLVAPLYATGSKELNVFGRLAYNVYNKRSWLQLSGSIAKYTVDDFKKDDGSVLSQQVTRIVPSIKYTLYNKDLRSKSKWIFNARSFMLKEDGLAFDGTDVAVEAENTIINQLSITKLDTRVLYPYNLNLTVDQGDGFVRAGFTGKYFFNYAKKGGLEARLFAGKFFYTKEKTFLTQFETDRYHLNMSGPKGYEDYTYSNYFVGRNEFEGLSNQQIMQRDGFFKVRTDLLGEKIGKTDDWLMALNVSSTIPDGINPLSILPFKIPLKVFADIGTYSQAWKDEPATGKFIYDAGLQLTLFKIVNVYAPIIYSKVYRDYFKSTITEKRFLKNISFSIDIQDINLRKISQHSPL